jgi:hypothetical protein
MTSTGIYKVNRCSFLKPSGRPSKIHSCAKALVGVSLFFGSHYKHSFKKLKNNLLSVSTFFSREILFENRINPFSFLQGFNLLSFVKNSDFLFAFVTKLLGGSPNIYCIIESYSFSFDPGSKG